MSKPSVTALLVPDHAPFAQIGNPSIIALLAQDHTSFAQMGRVPQTTAMVDQAIASAYENGDDFAEIDPAALDHGNDPAAVNVRDVIFLMNLLPDGFGKMSARLPCGTVITDGEFGRALAKVARAPKDGPDTPESKATVFVNVDLRMLRALPGDERPSAERHQG